MLILLLCSVVLGGIVFVLSIMSRPTADPAAISDGSRRTFLRAAGFLAPKMMFPWLGPRRSGSSSFLPVDRTSISDQV